METKEFIWNKKRCLLCNQQRPEGFTRADFQSTGMALMGFMLRGETVKDFLLRRDKNLKRIKKELDERAD